MWHWLIVHLHTVLAYGYEVLGGILIFYSSAVTETSMPEDRKRVAHWIVFGAIALVYAAVGIGLRYDEVQQGASDRQQAARDRQQSSQDRQELRQSRDRMDSRMDRVFSSFQSTYLQLASLSLDIHNMRVGLTETIHKNDPRQIADLEQQAHAAQQRLDSLSQELLALTMAPQIAQDLRNWPTETRYTQKYLHASADEERYTWESKHPHTAENDRIENEKYAAWDAVYSKAEADSIDQLKSTIATADFIRREMLQKIPPPRQSLEDKRQEKEFEKAKTNPESLNIEDAASYLEKLARRVPPP